MKQEIKKVNEQTDDNQKMGIGLRQISWSYWEWCDEGVMRMSKVGGRMKRFGVDQSWCPELGPEFRVVTLGFSTSASSGTLWLAFVGFCIIHFNLSTQTFEPMNHCI